MYCRKCGYHLDSPAQMCPKCGETSEKPPRRQTAPILSLTSHPPKSSDRQTQSVPSWAIGAAILAAVLAIAILSSKKVIDTSSTSGTPLPVADTTIQSTDSIVQQTNQTAPQVIVGGQRSSGLGDGSNTKVIGEFQEQTTSPYHDFVNLNHDQDYIESFDTCYGMTLSIITGSSMGGGAAFSNESACDEGGSLAEIHQGIRDAYDYYDQHGNVDKLDCSRYQKIEEKKQEWGMTDDEWNSSASEDYQDACSSAKSGIAKSAQR